MSSHHSQCIDFMKIGIYGGSFDPPHKGHRLLAENLMKACGAERLMVIPTAMSPFKQTSGASAEDRLQMCRLAFNAAYVFVVDAIHGELDPTTFDAERTPEMTQRESKMKRVAVETMTKKAQIEDLRGEGEI